MEKVPIFKEKTPYSDVIWERGDNVAQTLTWKMAQKYDEKVWENILEFKKK